jgi:hypothetical protein
MASNDFQMTKFKIEYTGWHSQKEETGFDYVYFDAVVHNTENNNISFPLTLSYRIIETQVEDTIGGGTNILQQIKKRNRGWGPRESIYAKELEECGIDLAMLFIKYIENNYNLEQEAAKWSKSSLPSTDLTSIVDELDDSLIDVKLESEQYFLICERLEKTISDEILGLFPQLLNSSSKHILKFEEILVKHISALGEDLNNLIFDAIYNADEA